MADIIPPSPIDAPFGSYNWQDWYFKVRQAINQGQSISWSQITNFTGSNLTSIATRNHNDLQNFQGGAPTDYYHLTAVQHTALTAGFTGTGNLVRQTTPTLTTPVIGAATGTSVVLTGGITTGNTTLHTTTTNLTNGAGAGAGTLTNAPAAGNPTKWLPVNDNGTTRYIPAW